MDKMKFVKGVVHPGKILGSEAVRRKTQQEQTKNCKMIKNFFRFNACN